MITRFFEAIYDDKRFVGMDTPDGSMPLQLYQITLRTLLDNLKWSVNFEKTKEYLQKNVQSVMIPQDCLRRLTLIPPLSPDSVGDVLVSGFMQTHNIKIDQTQADNNTQIFPNWFIKGLGSSLKVSGSLLTAPSNPVAICEEAEVVLIYLDDEAGKPQYCGYTFGNDLTDIGCFKRNPGHLAYAKLCNAGISYWFYAALPPETVYGHVSIKRKGNIAWQGSFNTGTVALGYDLDDMVNHLFSFPTLHQPNRIHYLFIGADRSSYHHGFHMEDGDAVIMDFSSHNVVLENSIKFGCSDSF